jgi:hypothetical protein
MNLLSLVDCVPTPSHDLKLKRNWAIHEIEAVGDLPAKPIEPDDPVLLVDFISTSRGE